MREQTNEGMLHHKILHLVQETYILTDLLMNMPKLFLYHYLQWPLMQQKLE